MPTPVSLIITAKYILSCLIDIVTLPFSGVYFMALSMRFCMARRNRVGSIWAGGRGCGDFSRVYLIFFVGLRG